MAGYSTEHPLTAAELRLAATNRKEWQSRVPHVVTDRPSRSRQRNNAVLNIGFLFRGQKVGHGVEVTCERFTRKSYCIKAFSDLNR